MPPPSEDEKEVLWAIECYSLDGQWATYDQSLFESFHSAFEGWEEERFQKVNQKHLRKLRWVLRHRGIYTGANRTSTAAALAALARLPCGDADWPDAPEWPHEELLATTFHPRSRAHEKQQAAINRENLKPRPPQQAPPRQAHPLRQSQQPPLWKPQWQQPPPWETRWQQPPPIQTQFIPQPPPQPTRQRALSDSSDDWPTNLPLETNPPLEHDHKQEVVQNDEDVSEGDNYYSEEVDSDSEEEEDDIYDDDWADDDNSDF